MPLRILISSTDPPCWGGAGTSAYALFEAMQGDGLDVAFIALIETDEATFLEESLGAQMGNPRGLPDAHTIVLRGTYDHPQPDVEARIARLAPDVILAVGSVAAVVLPTAAPTVPVVFLTTGCEQLKTLVIDGTFCDYVAAHDHIVSSTAPVGVPTAQERHAVEKAARVVAHSDTTLLLMERLYRPHRAKIHRHVVWFAEWIFGEAARHRDEARRFGTRDIDVLFVASSWTRPEKNLPAVEELARRLPDHRMHVVGASDRAIAGVTHHGLVARQPFFEILGNAKTVACVSTFDTAPGILFEAAAMGCNIVASRNCGNWQICHDDLLVHPATIDGFADAIRLSATRRFTNNIDSFLGTGSYTELKGLLASVSGT